MELWAAVGSVTLLLPRHVTRRIPNQPHSPSFAIYYRIDGSKNYIEYSTNFLRSQFNYISNFLKSQILCEHYSAASIMKTAIMT